MMLRYRFLFESAWHFVAFLVNIQYLVWMHNILESPGFGRHYRFMTNINHALETVFFLGSFFYDICSFLFHRERMETIRKPAVLEYLFMLGFTLSSMVGILFWALYFYDRELILPAHMEKIYPKELNIFQHGYIAVLMWLELLFSEHHVRERWLTSILVVVTAIAYAGWTYVCFSINGVWPYPFQNQWSYGLHALFYFIAIPISVCMNHIGLLLLHLRWNFGKKVVHAD